MNVIYRIKSVSIVLAFCVTAFLIFALSSRANAQSTVTPQKTTPTANTNTVKTNEVLYQYIAQPGDSFTKMARKAVQTYGRKYKKQLSNAKVVFAETNMTQLAGSPELEIGQKLSFKESDVKGWFDKATALTSTTEALWNYYVQFVDFNTNLVGQSK